MDRMDRGVAFSSWRSRFKRVSGATLALVVTGTLGRVITLLTQMVIAREFGVSMFSDAYFAMAIVPELFVSSCSLYRRMGRTSFLTPATPGLLGFSTPRPAKWSRVLAATMKSSV